MRTGLVNVNGVISPPEQAKVSVFDRGFLFGDGVYETGRSLDRCLLYWEDHVQRLRRSAARLQIPVPWPDEELYQRVAETARAFGAPDVYFRVILTRGIVSQIGLDAASTEPTLVIVVQPLPDMAEKAKKGVKLVTSIVLRNAVQAQDPNIKTSNYLNSLLALQDAKSRGGEDAVLCDAVGRVTEGTTFSLFGISYDGRLLTPALEVGILDSITRRKVLALAAQDRETQEGFFTVPELQACTEVFLASSVRGIFPVAQWDNRAYAVPGPVTAQLQQRLQDDAARYVAAHSKF